MWCGDCSSAGNRSRRPDGSSAPEFIRAVKEKYPQQLVMADCATLEEGIACAEAGADLWVLRCVATHRRQKDATISIMHLSMNFPKNALQRSLTEGHIHYPEQAKKRWKRVHLRLVRSRGESQDLRRSHQDLFRRSENKRANRTLL